MNENGVHETFLRQAIALGVSKMKAGFGGPFGALVVKDGVVVGEGFNAVTSKNDPTAHAEVQAIRAACATLGTFQLSGCDFYTSCEPCPMCLGAIYWARPSRIFFAGSRKDAADAGFDDNFIYEELVKSLDDRSLKITQLIAAEGRKAFELWISKPDKTSY